MLNQPCIPEVNPQSQPKGVQVFYEKIIPKQRHVSKTYPYLNSCENGQDNQRRKQKKLNKKICKEQLEKSLISYQFLSFFLSFATPQHMEFLGQIQLGQHQILNPLCQTRDQTQVPEFQRHHRSHCSTGGMSHHFLNFIQFFHFTSSKSTCKLRSW